LKVEITIHKPKKKGKKGTKEKTFITNLQFFLLPPKLFQRSF